MKKELKEKIIQDSPNQDEIERVDLRYDNEAEKHYSFPIPFKGTTVRTEHHLGVISDEDYIKWSIESGKFLKKAVNTGNWRTDQYKPKSDLWDKYALGVPQYGEKWRQRTKMFDKVNAINLYFHVQIEERPETDVLIEDENQEIGAEVLLNADTILPENDLFELTLLVLHGSISLEQWKTMISTGTLPDWITGSELQTIEHLVSRGFTPNMYIPTIHRFREETKDEADEFLAITTGKNSKSRLASMAKSDRIEDSNEVRKIALYNDIIEEKEGYKNGVPAWHKIEVIDSFFAQQFARMGKLQLS